MQRFLTIAGVLAVCFVAFIVVCLWELVKDVCNDLPKWKFRPRKTPRTQ